MIIDLISNTTTTTGLSVHCVLDTDQYPTGIKYAAKDVDALPITRHDFHGEWNYTVQPTRPNTTYVILSQFLRLGDSTGVGCGDAVEEDRYKGARRMCRC
jgi:hypothetical protein